jgi:hypothetical protein
MPRTPGNFRNDRPRFRQRRQDRSRDNFLDLRHDPAPASGIPNACPAATGRWSMSENRFFNVGVDMGPARCASRFLLLTAAHFRAMAGPKAIRRCREAPDHIHPRAYAAGPPWPCPARRGPVCDIGRRGRCSWRLPPTATDRDSSPHVSIRSSNTRNLSDKPPYLRAALQHPTPWGIANEKPRHEGRGPPQALAYIRPRAHHGLLEQNATGPRLNKGGLLVDPLAQTGHHRCERDHERTGETYHQHAGSHSQDQIN